MERDTLEQFSNNLDESRKAELKELKNLQEKKLNNAEALIEKKKILASEAKNIAETSQIPLTHIYKCIREEAKEGRVKLDWGIYNMSSKCIELTKEALIKDGYSVEVNKDENLLKISW
jgi:hypothetical protein